MNSNRRADLQRKLSLNAVPRPPAGLAERIKADIPKYLQVETERRRFGSAVAFNMRVAASILLVTTLVATLYVIQTRDQEKSAVATAPGPFAPAARALPQPQAASSTATEEVRLDITQDTANELPPQIAMATPPPPPAAIPAPRSRAFDDAAAQPVEGGVEGRVEGGVAGGSVGGVFGGAVGGSPGGVVTTAEASAEREAAPVPPPPAAAPVTAMADAPRLAMNTPQRREEKTAVAQNAVSNEVFGISVDPSNFQNIRETLEAGGRPAASAVDVEAIVNYFAGPPAKPPRRDVSLDVEVSPAAVEMPGDHAVLRVSVDTPAGAPIASDVRIEVVLNANVVARHSRVGGDESLLSESVLPGGTSVTGLYALELKQPLHPKQQLATVRMSYKKIGSKRKETITRHVFVRNLPKNWQLASRRHRLASLGALWGETLKGSTPRADIARRAEELATQDPKDARARELAAAANASADGSR